MDIDALLQQIGTQTGTMQAVLASREGYVIASHAEAGYDPEIYAALTASAVTTILMIQSETSAGEWAGATIEFENVSLMLFPAQDMILALVLPVTANAGLVRVRVKKLLPELLEAI